MSTKNSRAINCVHLGILILQSKTRVQAEEKKYNNGDLIKKYICKLFF